MIFSWSMVPYFIAGILIELLYTISSYESANLIMEITGIDEKNNPTYFLSIELSFLLILNMVTAIGENYFWPNALPPLHDNSNLGLRFDIDNLAKRMDRMDDSLIKINQNLDRINTILTINGSTQPVSYFLKNTNSILNRKKENYK